MMRTPVLIDWQASVAINLDRLGGPRFVGSTQEAALLLIDHWPVRCGAAFLHALRICAEALEEEVPPEEARLAFVAAAEEADIILRLH